MTRKYFAFCAKSYNGVKIYVPTEEELQAFKDGAAPTIDEYKGIVGEEACKAWGIE